MVKLVHALAFLVLLSAATAASAQDGSGSLTVTGRGGQSVVLDVPPAGLRLDHPGATTPRLPGPDGTVGGLLVQRASDSSLFAGLLLMNTPGRQHLTAVDLIGQGSSRLPRGRYVVTLIGSGSQTITFPSAGPGPDRTVRATGPARPLTRSVYGAGAPLSSWSDEIAVKAPLSVLSFSVGGGGDAQQGSSTLWCLGRAEDPDDGCTFPSAATTDRSPGGGGTWTTAHFVGSVPPGALRFAGRGVSAGGAAAHLGVIVDVPDVHRRSR